MSCMDGLATDLFSGLLMPFTLEEVRTVQYMIDSYNLSKETYVFSEQNDLLFRRLFQTDSESSPDNSKKYNYSSFDVGSLIMTVIKKNVFFVRTIDKARTLSHHYSVLWRDLYSLYLIVNNAMQR